MTDTIGVLVMFSPDVQPAAIHHSLDALGDTVLGWAQVFDGKPLYAVKVPADEAQPWKAALAQLPGATWSEVMLASPVFEEIGTYH